jgi:hypothetical protein
MQSPQNECESGRPKESELINYWQLTHTIVQHACMHAALSQANIVACAMRHDVLPSNAHLHLLTGPLHPLLKSLCLWIATAAPPGWG